MNDKTMAVSTDESASLLTYSTISSPHLNLNISRPIYNQRKFQHDFSRKQTTNDSDNDNESQDEEKQTKPRQIKRTFQKVLAYLHPRNLLEIFTIVNFIVEYDFKKNLFPDLFSGLTGKYLFLKTYLLKKNSMSI